MNNNNAFFSEPETYQTLTVKWFYSEAPNRAAYGAPTPFLGLQIIKACGTEVKTTSDVLNALKERLIALTPKFNNLAINEESFLNLIEANKNPTGDQYLPHISIAGGLDLLPRGIPEAEAKQIIAERFPILKKAFLQIVEENKEFEYNFSLQNNLTMLIRKAIVAENILTMNAKVISLPDLMSPAAFTIPLVQNQVYRDVIEKVSAAFDTSLKFSWKGPFQPLHTTLARIDNASEVALKNLLQDTLESEKGITLSVIN